MCKTYAKDTIIYNLKTGKVDYKATFSKERYNLYFGADVKAIYKQIGNKFWMKVVTLDVSGNRIEKTGEIGPSFASPVVSEAGDPSGEAVFRFGKDVVPEGSSIVELDIGGSKQEIEQGGTTLWRK